MEVILLQHVQKLGKMGDTVNVKPGFARNFLIPLEKAIMANEQNKAMFETKKALIIKENDKKKRDAQDQVDSLPASIVLIRQAGEDGKLFGSVTAKDIANSINNVAKTKLTKGQIALHNIVKFIGIYKADVHLHPEVSVTVTVNVARSHDEAEAAIASKKD